MSEKLLLVGGGQMGRALVGGILSRAKMEGAGSAGPSQTTVVDPSKECCQWWGDNQPDVLVSDSLEEAAAQCDVAILAVKPNIIQTVAQRQGLWDGKLVVSIAAGISVDQLCQWTGHQRVVRVMPNTPSLVGAGASAFCSGEGVSSVDRQWVESTLSAVGIAVEVDEKQIDAVTGLSGSGPAYVCMMIEALADGGVQAGLPRPLAMQLATQTVMGTAKMVAETGRHPGELKDAVASPGGTTIAAIASLEQNGLRGALIQAVAASAERSREMAKQL